MKSLNPLFMAATLQSYCLQGLESLPVRMEVDIAKGMPFFSVIGMAGTSLQEAKERVRSAIIHSGFKFPMTRKVVNLAPAEVNKRGSHFDVAIALGLLVSSGQIGAIPKDVLVVGELGLEGGIRGVKGILPAILFAKMQGLREVVLPQANLNEASLVEGIDLVPVKSLREVVGHFEGEARAPQRVELNLKENVAVWDFADITGHNAAKRALTVAAAGGHHVLMSGPPGSGKSLLARAFPSILPPLGREELLEVMQIYSVAGRELLASHLSRPFRSVHSSCTAHGLVGGGTQLMPGEISLAHRGVLFLDELPEFPRKSIEALRRPLEEAEIVLRRGQLSSRYPCAFQLVAAMNPCPCGHYGDRMKACRCSAHDVTRYQGKLSGPLMDRIDLHLEIPRISYDELQGSAALSSADMQAQVKSARELQRGRGPICNRDMSSRQARAEPLNAQCQDLLRQASSMHSLSGRAVFKLIKVARTIADLDAAEFIQLEHLMEALQYRVRS